ncbi:MAG TPA: IS1182 family transposase [Bacteroidia bacterium]|nr:IS1182 family transposase [Bacteroidia bacterium]
MDHIQSHNRLQVTFGSIDDQVEPDNPVRFIDAFVEQLDLGRLQFSVKDLKPEGRPSFNPRVFLKLYLYGYLNGIRSSRRLERECRRNIELHWLMQKLVPNYHSISDFRKDNPAALKNTFKLFVLFLKDMDLIAGHTVAIDGTKVRAHNSKKNNYSPKKIERHLQYIEEKTNEYLAGLDYHDATENPEKVNEVAQKIERLKQNKIKYELLAKQMADSRSPQVSTTDEDARALLVQGQVVEVCYNMQAAVDDKHKLVVATHTINRNDRNALSDIATEAKQNLQATEITALSDKGYHNGSQLQTCREQHITTICAQQEIVNSNTKGTTPDYLVTQFTYNKQADTYTCPQGQTLKTMGTWHTKVNGNNTYQFKKYRTPACKHCAVKHLCTGKEKGGREIERNQYAEAVEENSKRYRENTALYRTRQEINEHIFGTIKRKWGYSYTNLKGLKKVNGEMALIMTVYNMKRCMNILGIATLLEKIKNWKPDYKGITHLFSKMINLQPCIATKNFQSKLAA